MWDTAKSQKITTNIGLGIEIFLGIIGALTLIIGGVGVANIMYAVVKHRTKEITDALERINQGTFGKCEECGGTIPKGRLQALPYTRHCVACARKIQQSS